MKKIYYLPILLCIFISICSCKSVKKSGQTTDQKTKDGWITIFDGKTFNGWRGYNRNDIPSLWTIDPDGSMKINGAGGGEGTSGGGDILYDKKVKDFEFELEWKVAKVGGNSGIMYLAQEVKGEPMYISGPEYQILGNNNNEPNVHKSASLYDMIAARPQNANPIGEWNKAKIRVHHGKVTHYQNDVAVVEYTLWTPQWEELLSKSKFSKEKWPLAYQYQSNLGGDNKEGYIGLQDHGNEVWFRNIRLKELK
ncbi:MAG: DUF1080 domain-containing protein [Bacteroidales bacterium]|jgi:hypothetical protein|nr:DUF1080 domain-containing protein [Bacteroidales bacterium]